MKNKFVLGVLLFLFSLGNVFSQTNDPSRYANQSVLATGKWIKIKVEDTGFYKITYEKLKEWGITNPQKARVYGYGGEILSQHFTDDYLKTQDDLPVVAVWMNKSPENFGPGDYMVFYGKGSVKWTYEASTDKFVHTQNTYSNESFYFITESDEGPLLVTNQVADPTGANIVSVFDDYYLHEKDLVNITQSGREFYGESFKSKASQDFAFSFPGVIPEKATVDISFISKTTSTAANAYLSALLNNNLLFKDTYGRVSGSDSYYNKAVEMNKAIPTFLSENNVLTLKYDRASNSDDNMHLNYFRINYRRELKPYAAVTLFRNKKLSVNSGFKINNATNSLKIFDITNGEKPVELKGTLSGVELSFSAFQNPGSVREFAMVDVSKKIPEPSFVSTVNNQNLHGLSPKEMIVIVRPALKKYAEELAQLHKDDSGLESIVVTAEDIYNEFSSGKPDVTAYRRFLKMFYDRAQGGVNDAPKYLTLFGDGSYDNRFINSNWKDADKKAMILTYQSANSIHELNSYPTDDYIGFLDDWEGWEEKEFIPNGSAYKSVVKSTLDIGIGRITVRTEKEASDVLSKIRKYLADDNKGIWKNNIAFFADDLNAGDNSMLSESNHVKYSNAYTTTVNKNYPAFITNKIYSDSHERITTSNGGRYPTVNQMIKDKFDSGLLFFNYVGHGSTRSWTHEDVWNMSLIKELTNEHLPLLITATCDFGRFDADENSGGEEFFLNPKGGAISLFTTTRVVYGADNNKLNTILIDSIFEKKDGKPARLGDIIRGAKVELGDNGNKLRFALVGDPALRLSYPDDTYQIEITDVNGNSSAASDIQLKALEQNIIKGRIVDGSKNIFTGFQGVLDVVIYDSELELKTRGNWKDGTNSDGVYAYKDYTNMLFTGSVKVENGEFTIEFVTPKDILYSNDFGKMSLYAFSNDSKYQAQGAFLNYRVGGVSDSVSSDTIPPTISSMYLNRSDFVSGGKVNSTPMFYAKMFDNVGLNVSNGIGHNMSLTIDGSKTYDLRSSFNSTANDGSLKEGEVKFVLPELEEGKHHLLLRVWDLWNNAQTASLEFEVVQDYKPVVYDLKIKGNPAKEQTKFYFISDVDGLKVDVTYQVYSVTGQMVWSHEVLGTTDNEVLWDLNSNGGGRVSSGVYVCRMTVSLEGGVKATKSQKLIVLEQ